MKPIEMDAFSKFQYLSQVTFSPNGKTAAFVVTNADMNGNKYESRIYIKKGSKLIQLTNGGKESSFQFLDDSTILFAGDREKSKDKSLKSHFYSISIEGGEAKKYLTLPIPAGNVILLKNGDFIVEAKTYPGFEDLYQGDYKLTKKYLDHQSENEDYQVIETSPWWWNGGSYTNGAYNSIFYYTKKTRKLTRLTETGFDAFLAKLSKDEKFLFFGGKKVKPRDNFEETGLYRLELSTGKKEVIFEGSREFNLFSYELGDDFLLLAAVKGTHGLNTNPDFYKVSYEDLKISDYCVWSEAIGSSVGSDIRYGGGKIFKMVGNTCYFIATIFDSAYLYQLKDGKITRVLSKEGSVDCFDAYKDKLLVSALWDMKGAELYDENCKQLTRFNEKVLQNKYVAIPEKCNVKVRDTEIHGFVLKPFAYDPKKKYPVIFDIHGGPKTVYGEVYYHEMQFWAGKGYFVIFCNPTGSDGRGNAFMDIRGKYGTIDYEDLMAFADAALKAYKAMDKDRMFETGGSYGGFMTNWIIGHTNRFKACASQRSISNWFSFYGVSDIGVDFATDQCDTDAWKDPEKLWWHSPLKYADQVKTPTLFLHSEQDYRCPIDQAYQMYTALVARGIETRLIQFKGENHDLSRTGKPKHRLRRLEEITGWFEKHDLK